jgi:hypothetical protein
MNFPLEYPFFRFVFWFINTAGIGGLFIILLSGGLITAFLMILRWVVMGSRSAESDQFVYPTPTLLGHHDDIR